MSLRDDFLREHPDFPLLSVGAPERVESFLRARGWLEPGERVLGSKKAGEGNMNLTLRVTTDRRRMIVKQARPWVEKYPDIPAPWDRMDFEQRFYEHVRPIRGVGDRMPRLLEADTETRTMLLEDLPGARDWTWMYAERGTVGEDVLRDLGGYLKALHGATSGQIGSDFTNRAMRALNHQHLFEVPLADDNGVDLERFESGLETAAAELKADRVYRKSVSDLGRRYLSDGNCLVHGDYFPGSWLATDKGTYVIDPEFSFCGDPELDLGMACGHLALARQSRTQAERLGSEARGGVKLEPSLIARYAGIEIMRRLIGVAQLPIPPTDGFRREMLERSRRAVLEGRLDALWG